MNRAFVKENDLEYADVPERPQSEHPNYVTPTGLAQLQDEAAQLEEERLRLSPLKEDPIVRQQMAVIERDLRYVQGRLERVIPVNPAEQQQDVILFGAIVEVEDEEGATHVFEIVGEDEADIHNNKVSWVSPLARALIGQKVGDSVIWKRPAGDLALEVTDIRYHHS
ncbi:transcription elongation factor GreAB [Methylobacillus sp. MM3]|jgi:transcription elongation factor GreB|uniref:GreA/GreB family elongation factor n=1 Tax=Methylobacillus sp. MM3 TaxID=1848039 RepID=UPI0007DFFC58|nr:GreA/GreB family elongation factor [Methylobacillus sp. MM3]OAJ71876.1 transcription elongation factor GreAB [Methylobacillus sp. MM3]